MGIYIMAHRVNDSEKLDTALQYGANALEIDVTRIQGQYKAWHGMELDWNHAPLAEHLIEIRGALQESRGTHVSLIIIDVKYDRHDLSGGTLHTDRIGPRRLNEIRELVRDNLIEPINGKKHGAVADSGLFVLYTMTRHQEEEVVQAMELRELHPHEGFNYDAVAHRKDSRATPDRATNWQGENSVRNFMYSTGITATWHSATARDMAEASMALKQKGTAPMPFGTYAWTYNRANNAAHWLRDHDLDGVMGNMRRNFGYLPSHLGYYELPGRDLVKRSDRPPFLG